MVKYSMKVAKKPGNVYFQLAKRNLERKAARTILAAIGIIIGVVAISSMGILGNSLKVSVSNSFEDFRNEIIVFPAVGETAISENQVKQLDKVGGIESIIPIHLYSTKVDFKNKSTFGTVYGIESKDLTSLVEINDGKMLKSGSTDCVIGSDIANTLAMKVGEKITLEDTN
jgi:putative ABC transport system permease protein